MPTGAASATIVDVDGDGRADVAWFADVDGQRLFGITTASGATHSASFDSGAPFAATVAVNTVDQPYTVPIALVDLGRSVALFTLANCDVQPTVNAQGEQYTFDKGFTGYGTGVGCPLVADSRQLAGFNAVAADDGTYTVTQTLIYLDDDGTHATNGDEQTLGTGLAADDPLVVAAQQTSCGDVVAGQDGPTEPGA